MIRDSATTGTSEGRSALTVNWTLDAKGGEGRALACSPDVAQWLHDEVVQRLSSVAAAIASEGPLGGADRARCRTELEAALSALRLLLNEGAESSCERGFRTVAEAVRAACRAPGGDAAKLRIHGDIEVSPATGALVADFVAEAIRNVGKHAQAQTLDLSVTADEQAVRIVAANDGVLPASGGRGAGIGLRLLAARALDHRGFIATGATGSDGWATTLTLARHPHGAAGGLDPTTAAGA